MLEMLEMVEAFFESVLGFTILIFIVSSMTAIFGVLTGLGGGVLIVPILSFFQIDLRHAMGVSLISIVALSLMTATTRSSQLLTNVKMAVFLETAAVIGAVIGALIVPFLSVKFIAIFFGCILLFAVFTSKKRQEKDEDSLYSVISSSSKTTKTTKTKNPTNTTKTHIANDYFIKNIKHYPAKKLRQSWLFMSFSGMISGILGIGSGALKVFAMDRLLGLPYKVSTATSNFMVGMTAAASVGIYYFNNYFNYALMFPVIVGVYCGTFLGSELLVMVKTPVLRRGFNIVVFLLALQMFYKGIRG